MAGATLNVGGQAAAGTSPVFVTSVPSITPLKIKTLQICDFRAFAGPEPVKIILGGKNLLVYGENGAGKSSIFHALNEFFSIELADPISRKGRLETFRNRFSLQPPTVEFIEVELDDGKPPARWDQARHPADIVPESDQRIVNGAYRKAILDYRGLLDTNYRHGSGDVNLFDLCVRVLLRDYPAVHSGRPLRLFDLWRQLESLLLRKQLRASNIVEINALSTSFNQALRDALDLLRPKVDALLVDFGWDDLKLTALTTPGLTYNSAKSKADRAFQGRSVLPELSFRSLPIPAPQTFLNEARLSALALAIYFAGRQVCATTLQVDTPRLMVLDDVLIGLDQSNRFPVLRVLDAHFADWQIVLLTHDRVWFEMARLHLTGRTDWGTLELFEEIDSAGGSRSILRPQGADPVNGNIVNARNFYASHEYVAAAVHARVAFELSLKKLCDRKAISVRFHLDQRQTSSDELLTAIETWLRAPARATEKAALDTAIAEVKMWRKVVLNPFSHSTPVNLTAAEVIGAIDAVEKLHQEFQTHI